MQWMIESYGDRETERFTAGGTVRQWEPLSRQADKRLRILEATASLNDLALSQTGWKACKGSVKDSTRSGLTRNQSFVGATIHSQLSVMALEKLPLFLPSTKP